MESEHLPRRDLRATLCQVERGLFHINYRTDTAEPDVHELPRYQLGASASDAKRRIEKAARRCGFASVLWDDATVIAASLGGSEIVPAATGLAAGG